MLSVRVVYVDRLGWMWQSKKKFERECREAEKSQILFERLDNDINATKSEVEKVSKQLSVVMD